MSFEDAISELSDIVNQMEQNQLSLDASLKQFERGIQLAQASQSKLTDAEQKVSILLEKNGDEQLQPFENESSESS